MNLAISEIFWLLFVMAALQPILRKRFLGAIILGVVLGAFLGTRLLVRLTNQKARRFFLGVLLVLGVEMLLRGAQREVYSLHRLCPERAHL